MVAPTDIPSLARFILSPECRHIGVLTGAGISVASGIPDFRSPGGLYDQLQPDHLTTTTERQRQLLASDPMHVVSWEMFSQNAFPYLEVRRPFILGTQQGRWKPTVAHRFLELLHAKTGKLQRIYTQNIDGLHFLCDTIPSSKVIPVHGSINQVECEGCQAPMEFDVFCGKLSAQIRDIYDEDDKAPQESRPILCENCRKPLVKPSTVLFGRSLPRTFFDHLPNDAMNWDMLLVLGTSLLVSPANSVVPSAVDPNKKRPTVRVLINRDCVGTELGLNFSAPEVGLNVLDDDLAPSSDLFLQGDCDDVTLQLIVELGWLDDVAKYDLPPESAEKVERAQQDNAFKSWF